MSLHIVEEANRCLQCRRPLCREGCPVNTSIPEVIRLFKGHELEEAGAVLFENNPMSAICAIVCNHGSQCEGHCVLGRKGNPIHFSSIESYVSESYLGRDMHRIVASKAAPNGHAAAIVGSGPAGMVVATKLALAGCEVTMFEQKPKVGGVLEYGIPEFRLPKSYVDKYRELLVALGVRIRTATTIGGALKIEDLLRDGYDAVFVGTGAWRARTLGIKGQARGNVFFGIDYLVNPDDCETGRDVAVIGVGNVAMDVARTALRKGARHVTLFSNWGGVSASSDEVEFAELDGAQIQYGLSVVAVDERGPIFKRSVLGEDGTFQGMGDETVRFDADTTIFCVSQVPKNKLVLTTKGLVPTDRGTLMVDEDGMTTVRGVFAAGDVVAGPKTVVHAVDGAKRAAEGMLRYMGVTNATGEKDAGDAR
jgi:glutamate synthase (NADPH/NADH) small chain